MVASTEEHIRRLELSLAELEECPRSDECKVLHEHVYAAKVALLGNMYQEYEMNLQLAHDALSRFKDKAVKSKVQGLLGALKQAP